MIRSLSRSYVLAATVAALPLISAAVSAEPYDPRARGGVSVTITKQPSYLNTRTTPKPTSSATYETSAVYQPTGVARNSIDFTRYPLPSTFDIPGY